MMGKERLESEQGTSYTEFTYQHQQGSDFMYLLENKGVNVQNGGSDQLGNVTAGTELIRKVMQAEGAYGLTFPLLLPSSGNRRRVSQGFYLLGPGGDRLAGRQYEETWVLADIAQRRLAEEVTRFVHGDNGLQEALRPGAETKLDWKALEGIVEDLPSCSLTYEEVLNASVVDLCVVSELPLSKSTACRQLKQGGL